MGDLVTSLVAGVTSGAVLSAVLGFILHKRTVHIEEKVKNEFARSMEVFKSRREWKEESISKLLGPVFMQLDRTGRAFKRWSSKNLYLEQKVIRDGNIAIRNLLLKQGHIIPPELLDDAGKLIEHYDRWLEQFEKQREAENPDLDTAFVFVGPQGYPFPTESDMRFREAFRTMWEELYGQ